MTAKAVHDPIVSGMGPELPPLLGFRPIASEGAQAKNCSRSARSPSRRPGTVPARCPHSGEARALREPREAIRDEASTSPPSSEGCARDGHGRRRELQQRVGAAACPSTDEDASEMGRTHRLPIVGSDASGVVSAVGSEVSGLAVGDQRRRPRGPMGPDDPWVAEGNDPDWRRASACGDTTLLGSMAQFTKVQAHQCLRKQTRSVGGGCRPHAHRLDRYRMLHGWPPKP